MAINTGVPQISAMNVAFLNSNIRINAAGEVSYTISNFNFKQLQNYWLLSPYLTTNK